MPARGKTPLILFTIALALLFGGPAQAEFVSGLTGQTLLSNQPGGDAVARSLSVPWGGGFTSWGVLRDIVFTDASGHVAHANSLGNSQQPTESNIADGHPNLAGDEEPGSAFEPMFPTAERVKNSNSVSYTGELLTGVLDPGPDNGIPTGGGLGAGGLGGAGGGGGGGGGGFGSGGIGGIIGGAAQPPPDGEIPHPIPEPGGLLLAVVSLPGLLFMCRRKRLAAA